ncbi:hypothetical protein, partial [Phytobacter ursingii]
IPMEMRLMNSKEGPYNFNELIGEAAFDVLLTDQPVTTASIVHALRARMLKELNSERCPAYQAAIDTLTSYAEGASVQRSRRKNGITRSRTEQFPPVRPGKYRH